MKILYVEDDPLDADLTRRELAKTAPQFELDVVTSVHEARERLKDDGKHYDLALIDLKLPNGDGMELLRIIRERGLPLPVVIITGRGDEDTAVAALKAGADDYVVKRQNYLANLPLTLKDVLQRSEDRASRRARSMRVLYAEHSATDIDLTERHLARHARHIELEVLQTGEEVLQRLSNTPEGWDVLLLDYNLPGTNVLGVLKEIRQRRGLDIPIVLVTGQGSEEVATQVLKLGAADYVVKNPGYLFQLPSVLENVFHRAQLARERAALRESEAELSAIIENSPFVIMIVDQERRVQKINHTGSEFAGRLVEDILGLRGGEALRCIHALDDPQGCGFGPACENCVVRNTVLDTIETGESHHGVVADMTFLRQEREERRTLLLYTTPLTISGERQVMVVFQDVTERRQAERLLRALNSAALATEQAFTPEEVFNAVAEEFKKVGFSCALYLTDEEQTKLFPKYLTYESATIRAAEKLAGIKHEGFSIPIERADAYREVVREKKTVFVENAEDLVRQLLPRPIKRFTSQIVRIVGIQKAIDAPLVVDGEVIGILAVQSDDLTAADAPAITAFAHQMAAVWHKAQLFEQAQDLTRKLKAIARPARQMSALMDRDELASQVVQSLQEITDCYNANLFLREGDDLVFAAGRGGYKDDDPPLGYRLPLGQGIIGYAARSGQPVLVPDVRQDSRYKAWEGLPHTRSELTVPIKRGDRVLGVMDMQARERNAFNVADLEALGVLADQLAVALENARLFEETQRLKQFNENIVQSMAEGIVMEDVEEHITFVNPMAEELLGYTPQELLGQHWKAIVPAEHRAKAAQESAKRPQGIASSYETALLRKDGDEIPVIVSARPLFDDERFSGVLSVFTDITERKRAEEALRESEAHYRSLFSNNHAAMLLIDPTTGAIEDANPAACAYYGYEHDVLTAMTMAEVNVLSFDQVYEEMQRAKQEERNHFFFRHRLASGKVRDVEVYSGPIQVSGQQLLYSIIHDITERKRAERALQEYTQRLEILHEIDQAILEAQSPQKIAQAALGHLRQLVPCVAAGIATFDLEAGLAAVLAVDADRGHALKEGMRFPLEGLTIGDGGQRDQVMVEDDILAAHQPATPLVRAMQADGVRSYIAAPLIARGEWLGALRLHAEQPAAFSTEHVEIVCEIAGQIAVALHQSRLSAALKTERRRLETTVKHAPEGILLLDAECRILLANPVAEKPLALLTDARVDDVLARLAEHALEDLLIPPPGGPWHELEIPGPPQRVFEVLAQPVSQNERRPEGWVLTMRDVTEERKVQKCIQQQERLAAVGQLAGGIAHDFNNLLTTIMLYAQMSLGKPDLPLGLTQSLEIILGESRQAAKLVQQILDFSRHSSIQTRPMDLKPFVEETVHVLRRTIPESMSFLLEVEPGEYVVSADPTRIQQVLINLVVNARDAMPEGGVLRIGLSQVTVTVGEEPLTELSAGEWIRLSVSDTGAGIPPEVLPHIFEPFFTTKEPGEGSGLGLAQVHGIVGQHGGHVGVDTQPGEGTTFTVYLPALAISPVETPPPDDLAMPHGRGELVLVVEDGDVVRTALVESLEQWNYRTLEAANGEQALALVKQYKEEIALILSDVVMPGMGGIALFWAIREEEWQTPVILLTGHPMAEELDELRAQGLSAWLSKPPDLERLARAIDDALHKRGKSSDGNAE